MTGEVRMAPGGPGIDARWTSAAKSGVGCSLRNASPVWFTLSHGIIDEVYYGRLDWACTRDMGLLVSDGRPVGDGRDWLFEEKRQARHEVKTLATGVPAYVFTNTDPDGRFVIEKEIITDPRRPVVLQRTRFKPLKGSLSDYHLYVLLAPHLGNQGGGNTAWIGEDKGQPMLFAERDGSALALASTVPWLKRSAGYVGTSDGWHDLQERKQMTREYDRAENGNVALMGEIDLASTADGEFILALGFGGHALEAGHHARGALFDSFASTRAMYVDEWEEWQKNLLHLEEDEKEGMEYRISTAALRIHQAKSFPGSTIASLSIPWGDAKGDQDLGGYHLVWTRDMAEAVGGLMAAEAGGDAARVLRYLQVTQEADGHWTQNMWLDGTPYWSGVQMDETAFPVLLTETAWRRGLLEPEVLASFWPMVRKAISYVVCNGPVTQEDRWEEEAGYSPFTLAVEIAGLLAAADLAGLAQEPVMATYLAETADTWNEYIDRWTYATGTDLAKKLGVEGYYVRIAPPDVGDGTSLKDGYVPIKNRPPGQSKMPTVEIISPDALALVRFGLRAPDDRRIVNTVRVIDALLKVETPYGPCWHRYNNDGYGEHADGSPYDGTGIGRLWPLLTGERGHYELAAGHRDEAIRLMHAMEAFAGEGGLLPEQIWDAADIPDRELVLGRPSGSAMPLVWAHAEYVKLRRSLREERVFDCPPQTVKRYLVDKTTSKYASWRFNQKARRMDCGKTLRVEVKSAAIVHWTADDWQTTHDTDTFDTTVGVHAADLATASLPEGAAVQFTFHWRAADRWEGTNYAVKVGGAG
jgi:glucoamylase